MLTREAILELCQTNPEGIVTLLLTLQESNEQLAQRVKKLEDQLNKDSRNSHKPPSSDGVRKRRSKPKPNKSKVKKCVGGQLGHQGQTLKMTEKPSEIVRHEPAQCQGCGTKLDLMGGTVVGRRQEVDIPEPKLLITEHQAIEKRCPCCEMDNRGQLPQHLKGNVQYGGRLRALTVYMMSYQLLPYQRTTELLNVLYGLTISTGTLYRMLQDGYNLLGDAEARLKQAIQQAEVVHVDETGHRVSGQTNWLHVSSTPLMTYYNSHEARGKRAHEAAGILPAYRGVAVHDFYRPYLGYACKHGLCNAHLLRDLQGVLDDDPTQRWAKQLQHYLITAKRMVDKAHSRNATALPTEVLRRLESLYDQVVARAAAINPKPPPSGKPGPTAQSKTRNLIDRLLNYKEAILRFIFDFKVPFDNNLAERDLRMVKVQQKISNCFRSQQGVNFFCRLRGYISTLQKQKLDIFAVLTRVFQGDVLVPLPAE